MRMHKKLYTKLNEQVNHEFHAAYLYLSMSAYFEDANFSGFAAWMHAQVKEEMEHAMKIFNYLLERGEKVELTQIAAPKTLWKTPLEAFQDSLKHEEKVTALINTLMDVAIEVNDHAAVSFLQWYVDEQVEEEANVSHIIAKLEMIKENKPALLGLDHHLGKRGKE